MNVAEYKLKVRGEGWEETPVFVVVNIDAAQHSVLRETGEHISQGFAYAVAYGISKAYNCEVRWNWVDTYQGHYVGTGSVE